MFRELRRRGPDADTLLYHLKKYNNINEVQKMFVTLFEIIWEMARKANLFNIRKRVDLAIDYTEWFYYGSKNTTMTVGKKPERGATSCYKFATIGIVDSGKRFTLLALPVSGIESKEQTLSKLLSYALQRVKINKVYVDRGFYDSRSIQTFNMYHVKFLMPAKQDYSVRRVMEIAPTPSIINDFVLKVVRFNLVIVKDDDGVKRAFATNEKLNENDEGMAERLFFLYGKRWGIETSYRIKKHSYLPKTTSKNYLIRLFYFLFSVLMYNLWILADILIWLHLRGGIGDSHLVTSRYFGMILMSIDPGG